MTNRSSWMLAAGAALALAACATTRESETAGGATARGSEAEGVTEQLSHNSSELQTYRIRDWSAPNNRTLIVESVDGRRYEARFMTDCLGLQFTETIGFITRGLNELDKFSGIVLPDGTRCTFRSFTEIPTPR